MKIRLGYVSNSSSSSFLISNISDERKTIVDFVRENPQLIEYFVSEYDWHSPEEYNQKALIESAEANNDYEFAPGETVECIFGDEDGTMIGLVFDYILRDGGGSASFSWCFHEYHR
jgi:hypothetical protein